MTSHYSLNVARAIEENRHKPFGPYYLGFCKIDLGHNREEARKKAQEIAQKFPASEGWKLELTYWEEVGYHVDMYEPGEA